MATTKKRKTADVIIVGTGPAGSTAALELANRGKQVLLIETGKDDPLGVGVFHTFSNLYEKFLIFSRTKEGIIVDVSKTLGGSSAVFSGNAFRPPSSFQKALGMNLETTVDETIEELNIAVFPDQFMAKWNGTHRLVTAAAELGVNLKPQLKFIDPTRCNPGCDGCMGGCRMQARWTARDYVRKAQAYPGGARLMMETTVEQVLIDHKTNQAIGVKVRGKKGPSEIYADTIILAAGGMTTPIILQRSGIEAGNAFFMDPMDVVVGFTKEKGPWKGMTFSHACEDYCESDQFIVGNSGGMNAWIIQLVRFHLGQIFNVNKRDNAMAMFTKIADDNKGKIDINGRISKVLTDSDYKKIEKGSNLCKEILVKAGCDPKSFSVAHGIGGHPGGSAAIGDVVDENFETYKTKNLYVCDTSVFPRSPGVPPVLTIIATVKQWARKLEI